MDLAILNNFFLYLPFPKIIVFSLIYWFKVYNQCKQQLGYLDNAAGAEL